MGLFQTRRPSNAKLERPRGMQPQVTTHRMMCMIIGCIGDLSTLNYPDSRITRSQAAYAA